MRSCRRCRRTRRADAAIVAEEAQEKPQIGRFTPGHDDSVAVRSHDVTAIDHTPQDFGANSWLVDEMYGQYVTDPASVSESWREFFSDYRGSAPATFGHQPAPAAGWCPNVAGADPR